MIHGWEGFGGEARVVVKARAKVEGGGGEEEGGGGSLSAKHS